MTMKAFCTLTMILATFQGYSQLVTVAPNANTIIISTNTTIGIGGGNFKTYLVCPGATLSYAESSTMDTILLEPGASLRFDSAISYGYASVYAKNGSTVDMNFRQTGKLIYEQGATIIDTNIGPPTFLLGKSLAAPLNFIYSNLPGGIGCAPNAVFNIEKHHFLDIWVHANQLSLKMANEGMPYQVKIFNSFGQIISKTVLTNEDETLDISALPTGVYFLAWKCNEKSGSKTFVR